MPIKTSNSGGDFEKAPEGMHVARCFKVVDCGTHFDEKWHKAKRLGWLYFELPNALMSENDNGERRPFIIGKRYTLSHNEKAILRLDLESWYGKKFNTGDLNKAGGFDLEKLVGRPAMINVVHSDDGNYANIMSINPLPQGTECPPQVNASFTFAIDEVNTPKFQTFSEKMQAFIKESRECAGKPAVTTQSDDFYDDSIPF